MMTPRQPRSPDRRGLPPPLALDLTDGDRRVGWIRGDALGFDGFGDAREAAHAAWVAHRTIARRHARQRGGRSVLVDTEPLALGRLGDVEVVLASGVPVATLLRPGPGRRGASDTFAFELRVPGRGDELTMRATAHRAYRTLRSAGVHWATWTGERAARPAPRDAAATVAPRPSARPSARPEHVPAPPTAGRDWGLAALGVAVVLWLALLVPSVIGAPLAFAGLAALTVAGIAGRPRGWWDRRSRPPAPPRRAPARPGRDPSSRVPHATTRPATRRRHA